MYVMERIRAVNKPLLFLLLLCFFYLLSCSESEEDRRERERRALQRQGELDPILVKDGKAVYGRYTKSDYKGPTCEDAQEDERQINDEDCEDVCDRIYNNKADECTKLAVQLIETLDQVFSEMSQIGNNEDLERNINAFNFGVMIDIDIEPALMLIRDWNSRETTEFLTYSAKTPAITAAFVAHDKESKILKSAYQKISNGSAEQGMAQDLQGFGKTFLALAKEEKNPSAFMANHRLLLKLCSNKNCKLKNYCAREKLSQTFGNRRSICPYSNNRQWASRSSEYCYTHGPDVWVYWNELNRKRVFKDDDFPESYSLREEECDVVCKTEQCNRTN